MTVRRIQRPFHRTVMAASLAMLLPMIAACGSTPPLAPDAQIVDPPADTGSVTDPSARAGTFVGLAGHLGAGGVAVRMLGDTAVIKFENDFRSTKVPGPYVYLNTVTDANQGEPIRIAALVSPVGAQTYAAVVPTNVTYKYVLVWCDPFNVGVAAAELQP